MDKGAAKLFLVLYGSVNQERLKTIALRYALKSVKNTEPYSEKKVYKGYCTLKKYTLKRYRIFLDYVI